MDLVKSLIADAWNKKRLRIRLILGAIFLMLGVVFILKLGMALFSPAPLEGAVISTMCRKCGSIEDRRVVNINSARCSKCGGLLGYHQKCLDCGKEFPFVRPDAKALARDGMTKKEIFEELRRSQACPNCGSIKTFAMSADKKSLENGR